MTAFGEARAKQFAKLLERYWRALANVSYADEAHDAEQDLHAWVHLVLDEARTVESQLAQEAPDAEMRAWVDSIADERIALLQRKYVGVGFTPDDQQRIDFCTVVLNTAHPPVTLAQWRELDGFNTRYKERHK
jgi:hypothetical protein